MEARLRILGGGQVEYATVSVGAVCGYMYSSCLSRTFLPLPSPGPWGGRVVRWYWVNFQSRGILLIRVIVGQGPIALPGGVGGGCLDIFSLVYNFSLFSSSLWETAQYRLKYCLKGPFNPRQPTNQILSPPPPPHFSVKRSEIC